MKIIKVPRIRTSARSAGIPLDSIIDVQFAAAGNVDIRVLDLGSNGPDAGLSNYHVFPAKSPLDRLPGLFGSGETGSDASGFVRPPERTFFRSSASGIVSIFVQR
jgi:hypothetical protein